ncbi:glyoxalase superfamily protein [Acidovorax sp. ACV01]|uniref:glyoxalase superfamily protein n=1 Tax=Acidovorax sp. ACV01 TaxID=2769311 RepID=UPI00351C7F3D
MAQVITSTAIDNMKREAKRIRKATGVPHHAALEQVAASRGFQSWKAVMAASATTAASVVLPLSTPPIGTPGAVAHGGNSTPARALVAGAGKSPAFGPVSGK